MRYFLITLILTYFLCLTSKAQSLDSLSSFYWSNAAFSSVNKIIDQQNSKILVQISLLSSSQVNLASYKRNAEKAAEIINSLGYYIEGIKADIETQWIVGDKETYKVYLGSIAGFTTTITQVRTNVRELLAEEDRSTLEADLLMKRNDFFQGNWQLVATKGLPFETAISLLDKVSIDAKTAFTQILQLFYNKAAAESLTNTNAKSVSVVVVPKSNLVLSGGKFEADILPALYDENSKYNVIINEQIFEPVNGITKCEFTTAGEGTQSIKGYLNYTGSDQTDLKLPFEIEYTVFKGAATISADAMNVFYIGIDNPVSISVPGFPPDNVTVTMTGGSIVKVGSTSYIVKCSQRGDAVITVSVNTGDGTKRPMGAAMFRVRKLVAPVAQLGTLANGAVETAELIKQNTDKIYCSIGEGFPVEGMSYKVLSYDFSVAKKTGGVLKSLQGTSDVLTGEMKGLISKVSSGDKIIIDNIKVTGPGGDRTAPPIVVAVK